MGKYLMMEIGIIQYQAEKNRHQFLGLLHLQHIFRYLISARKHKNFQPQKNILKNSTQRTLQQAGYAEIVYFAQLEQTLQLKSSVIASQPSTMADPKHLEAMISFSKHFLKHQEEIFNVEDLSDGVIFARMLETAESFRFNFGQIDQAPRMWVQKLRNLKFLVAKIEKYFEARLGKGIITKDIKLFEIAKHYSKQETFKFFQIVIAVLTEAPNKQEHIALIMKQQQSIQAIFVEMIQRILDSRIILKNESRDMKILQHLSQLEAENKLMEEQIRNSHEQLACLREEVQKLNNAMAEKQKSFAQFIQKLSEDPEDANHDLAILYQQIKHNYDSLKQKILDQTQKNQLTEERLRQENFELHKKISKLQDVEEILQLYKEKYNEALETMGNATKIEKENQRMHKMITEKDYVIKKIQEKLDEAMNDNFQLQEKEINLQMELQRRDVRFLQLQRELKKKIYNNEDQSNTFTISDPTSESLTAQLQEMSLLDIDDIKSIKRDLDKTTKKCKEIEKENFRLRRVSDRFCKMQEEKKKLERIIFGLTQQRCDEITILVSALQHLEEQNRGYVKLLKQNKILE